MTSITATDFRNNMTHYLELANSGERVELRSRSGNFFLTPKKKTPKRAARPKRDVTAVICQAMKDWKEYLETGKSDKFLTWEEMMNELRNLYT